MGEIPLREWLTLKCFLPHINVPVRLEFIVNGRRAKQRNPEQVQRILAEALKTRRRLRAYEYSIEGVDKELGMGDAHLGEGTVTQLKLMVQSRHVHDGSVEVRCRATAAGGVYHAES